MNNTICLGCNKMCAIKTIDNDGPRKAKGKVNILAREKLTDANNGVYYTPKQEQNCNNIKQNQQNTYID